MKVLLIKDVKSLGKAGEIKEVKEGYGYNFLVAKGFAKVATDAVIKQYNAAKKKEAEDLKQAIADLNVLKEKLKTIRVQVKKPVGEGGSLFGSVTKDEISTALKEQKDIEIDKKIIETGTIKHIGIFDVEVKFRHSITGKFEVEVVAE